MLNEAINNNKIFLQSHNINLDNSINVKNVDIDKIYQIYYHHDDMKAFIAYSNDSYFLGIDVHAGLFKVIYHLKHINDKKNLGFGKLLTTDGMMNVNNTLKDVIIDIKNKVKDENTWNLCLFKMNDVDYHEEIMNENVKAFENIVFDEKTLNDYIMFSIKKHKYESTKALIKRYKWNARYLVNDILKEANKIGDYEIIKILQNSGLENSDLRSLIYDLFENFDFINPKLLNGFPKNKTLLHLNRDTSSLLNVENIPNHIMDNINKTAIPKSDKECFAYYEYYSLSTIKLYTQSKMAPEYIQSLFETRDEQYYIL